MDHNEPLSVSDERTKTIEAAICLRQKYIFIKSTRNVKNSKSIRITYNNSTFKILHDDGMSDKGNMRPLSNYGI